MERVRRQKGFTLIELLIVVAIIAILALIAVPNFLEAQTRAKVSRVMSDHRSLGLAIDSYRIDWDDYPLFGNGIDEPRNMVLLSTPVAYISNSRLTDPFKLHGQGTNPRPVPNLSYIYIPFVHYNVNWDTRIINDLGSDWAGNVDDKFWNHGRPAFPRVLGQDLGWGPPQDASKFPGSLTWVLTSYGPDFSLQFDNDWAGNPGGVDAYVPYDPTNGTVSAGDIYRFGGQ